MEHRPGNCRDVLALLSEYVDFELPPAACNEVEKHLGDCPACLAFLESLCNTIALCRTYSPDPLPAPLSDRAHRELEDAWRKMLAVRARPAIR